MGRNKQDGRRLVQAVDEDKFTKETHVWVVKKFGVQASSFVIFYLKRQRACVRLYMVL